MPIEVSQWRAGIALKLTIVPVAFQSIPFKRLLKSVFFTFTSLYLLIGITIVILLLLCNSICCLSNVVSRHLFIDLRTQPKHQNFFLPVKGAIFAPVFVLCFDTYLLQGLVSIFNFCFLSSWKFHCLINRIQKALPLLTYAFLLVNGVDIIRAFDLCKLLLLSGNIELNPGPQAQNVIWFFGLNSIGI